MTDIFFISELDNKQNTKLSLSVSLSWDTILKKREKKETKLLSFIVKSEFLLSSSHTVTHR